MYSYCTYYTVSPFTQSIVSLDYYCKRDVVCTVFVGGEAENMSHHFDTQAVCTVYPIPRHQHFSFCFWHQHYIIFRLLLLRRSRSESYCALLTMLLYLALKKKKKKMRTDKNRTWAEEKLKLKKVLFSVF